MAARFFIRQPGGGVQGPFEVSRIQDWIATGKVREEMEFSEDGAMWRLGSDWPDLFPPTVPVAVPPQPAAMPTIPCAVCGETVRATAAKCRHCGEWLRVTPQGPSGRRGRSRRSHGRDDEPVCTRGTYIVLGLFLGGLGIHNFVAGRTTPALVQLLGMIFLWWLVFPIIAIWIWTLVEVCTVTHDGHGARM